MRRPASGFSLIELAIALALTAMLGAGLLLWFARPIEALIEHQRRAGAADRAERALMKITAELASALPHSARVACGGRCLEFLPVTAFGDYRAEPPGDRLDFASPDDAFDVLDPLSSAPAPGMHIVINNQSAASSGSLSAYSADAQNNRGTIAAGTTAARIRLAPKLFPAPSPTQRFYVVATPVSYLCDPAPSGGSLRRLAGYPIQPLQPDDATLGDLLADDILECAFTALGSGVVAVRLTAGAESPVALFGQGRVIHTP